MIKTELENGLDKLKVCSKKLNKKDSQEIIILGRDSSVLVSHTNIIFNKLLNSLKNWKTEKKNFFLFLWIINNIKSKK